MTQLFPFLANKYIYNTIFICKAHLKTTKVDQSAAQSSRIKSTEIRWIQQDYQHYQNTNSTNDPGVLKAREKRYVFRAGLQADIEGASLIWRVAGPAVAKARSPRFFKSTSRQMSRQRSLDLNVLDGVYGRRSGTEGLNYWGHYTQIEEF